MNESDSRYDQLRARYAGSLARKQGDLAQAWRALAENPAAVAARRELHLQIHRLNGSASSYGYARLGALAHALDELMSQTDANGASSNEAPIDFVARLGAPIQALLAALAEAHARATQEPPAIP